MAAGDPVEGVALARSSLGGFLVEWNGTFIGWIHENRDKWNAYVRGPRDCDPGIPLGCYEKGAAIRAVAEAAGWPGSLKPRDRTR